MSSINRIRCGDTRFDDIRFRDMVISLG